MRKKLPQIAALSTAELVVMAGKPTLSAHLRKRVIASFEKPETLEELQAAASQVPEDLVADPFVAALRRICHPSSRLRLVHRRAIAEVGSAPHGFVALVIEEARTFSLRHYNDRPVALQDLTPWLEIWQERLGQPAATAFLRSASYRLFVATFVAVIGQGHGALADIAEESKDLWEKFDHLEFESALSFALLVNVSKQKEARGLFKLLVKQPRQGEELVLLEFGRAWVEGLLHEDIAGGKLHLEAALAAMDEDCDPWLELFLRLHIASLIAALVETRFPTLEDRTLALAAESLDNPPQNHPIFKAFDLYFEDLRREQESFQPAIEHIKAAEKLVDELASTESRIQFLRLRSRLSVVADPVQSLHDILDAIVLVQSQPADERLDTMVVDALFVKTRQDETKIRENIRIAAGNVRYSQIVTPYMRRSMAKYRKTQGRRPPA